MEIPPALLQFLGSLAAILAIAWLVLKLKLGGDVRIRGEDHARELADEQVHGYQPTEIAIDQAGYGAIMRDADGRVLVLRRHGAHFAGRVLSDRATSRLDQRKLVIGTDDARFGTVTLDLGDDPDNGAAHWAESLRRL